MVDVQQWYLFYNRTLREWRDVTSIFGISNFFTCMDMDRNGDIWAGTSRSGLRHVDGRTFAVSEMPDLPLTNGGMLHNDIYTVMSDSRGGLWLVRCFRGFATIIPACKNSNWHRLLREVLILPTNPCDVF